MPTKIGAALVLDEEPLTLLSMFTSVTVQIPSLPLFTPHWTMSCRLQTTGREGAILMPWAKALAVMAASSMRCTSVVVVGACVRRGGRAVVVVGACVVVVGLSVVVVAPVLGLLDVSVVGSGSSVSAVVSSTVVVVFSLLYFSVVSDVI